MDPVDLKSLREEKLRNKRFVFLLIKKFNHSCNFELKKLYLKNL